MRIDAQGDRTMIATLRRKGTRGPWLHVLAQVLDLAGGHAEFLHHREQPWITPTFTGTRHAVSLAFTGSEAVQAGEALIAALPEHEFTLAGHFVAAATICAADHAAGDVPRLAVECELLVVKED